MKKSGVRILLKGAANEAMDGCQRKGGEYERKLAPKH